MSFLVPMSWGLPEQPWRTRRLLTQQGAVGSTACAWPSRDLAKLPVGCAQREGREGNVERLMDLSLSFLTCEATAGGGESGELRHRPLV